MNNLKFESSMPSRSSVARFFAHFLMLLFLSSALYAARFPETDRITVDSVNLSARKFFVSYMSNDADERRSAELYLLGAMDAAEGKSWCDYQTFKTVTIRERVFEEFKKLNDDELDERASLVIERILSRRYPCGRKK